MKIPYMHVPALLKDKYYLAGLGVVVAWILPLLLTMDRIEYGDFSYFSQIYQAIKLSILDYHQFPWWNPWMAGGVPLYGNPQAGVFSVESFLSLLMPVPLALKLTISLFYVGGYISFLYLMNHLGIKKPIVALLGLVWVLNGFFVAHMPAHFTFIWFLLTPAFALLALRLRSIKSGIILGAALGVMALDQVHYSFLGIGLVVATIVLVRLIRNSARRQIFMACLWAIGVFLVMALHRIVVTFENIRSSNFEVHDPASRFSESVYGFLLPYSNNFHYFVPPSYPHFGWMEQTVYPSVFTPGAMLITLLFIGYTQFFSAKKGIRDNKTVHKSAAILLIVFVTFMVGIGDKFLLAPYHLLKMLPMFHDLRVSARWFIFTVLAILIFIGVAYMHRAAAGYQRYLVNMLLIIAVVELFVLNFGYFNKILVHPVSRPPRDTPLLTFQQQIRFGESSTNPDGLPIPGADKQYLFREYESTLFNIGTILANEAHVDVYNNSSPRCSYVNMCGLVLSKNADVAFWSPNKIILKRTSDGPIELNMNNSTYVVVNGKRSDAVKVVDRSSRFILPVSHAEQEITITFSPNTSLGHLAGTLR